MENLVFGKLVVLSYYGNNKRGDKLWNCKCECGNDKVVKGSNLRRGLTSSCGCINTGPKIKSLVGEKFNKLTILRHVGRSACRSQLVECQCDCGNICTTLAKHVKYGLTKSCGCWQKEFNTHRKGKLNHNYNHNITDEEREIGRLYNEYYEWQKNVKILADFTCNSCKKRGGELTSHHLDGFHWCIEGRTDINNGVCLCESCHRNFHNRFGYKNNTKEQYKNFIENET
jgi:hypothetical protein